MRSFVTVSTNRNKEERGPKKQKRKETLCEEENVSSSQAYMLHWKFGTKQETPVVNMRPKRFEHSSTTNQSFVKDDLKI